MFQTSYWNKLQEFCLEAYTEIFQGLKGIRIVGSRYISPYISWLDDKETIGTDFELFIPRVPQVSLQQP